MIYYTYNAAGQKLRKFYNKTSGTDETTDYIGGVHYKNNVLDFIQHTEGRARKNGSTYEYEYNLTDHLGNVRVTVSSTGSVIQRDDYYPFGLAFNSYTSGTKNNYLYNQGTGDKTFQGDEGKSFNTERQQEFQLDMTKFRLYDYALGRFTSVDPLADFAPQESYTPYHYASNNPIRYSDPNGDCFKCSLEQVGAGVRALGNLLGINQALKAVEDGLRRLDQSVEGDEPDTRGPGDRTNIGGETLTKTDGSKGSQAFQGKPSTENDITQLTNAKGVGGANTSTPSSTVEIVKDVADAANQMVEVVTTVTKDNEIGSIVTGRQREAGVIAIGSQELTDSSKVQREWKSLGDGSWKLVKVDTVNIE